MLDPMAGYFADLRRRVLAANAELSMLPRCHGCAGEFPVEALDERGLCTFCAAELKQQPDGEDRPAA